MPRSVTLSNVDGVVFGHGKVYQHALVADDKNGNIPTASESETTPVASIRNESEQTLTKLLLVHDMADNIAQLQQDVSDLKKSNCCCSAERSDFCHSNSNQRVVVSSAAIIRQPIPLDESELTITKEDYQDQAARKPPTWKSISSRNRQSKIT
ncbi:unnamed protein product [Phytophthora lilii]|uniref:Unnamed protein product n=1 Tax=Phytophthora lilii TaxID=2077276 RepID=A0A9W6X6I5_9STRA|nr:unnamed protein product [Phytophthora lilii]